MGNDFEQERKDAPGRLAQAKGQKAEQRTTANPRVPRPSGSPSAPREAPAVSPPKKRAIRLVVFGARSLFTKNLVVTLRGVAEVSYFTSADATAEACGVEHPAAIVLDMDEPTKWQSATDVYSVVSMEQPDVKFILCTKNPLARHVRTLESRGAMVLTKPVSIEEMLRFCGKPSR